MKLYSYVIARDFGFAPNPFCGYCTLATCKPTIRRTAQVSDWIVGTGSKKYGLVGHVVFAMRVAETLTFDQYWNDPRFAQKRPNLRGSLKQWFGDNVYHHSHDTGRWLQENCHHSRHNGRAYLANIQNDTQTDRILVANDFVYWGALAPKIPSRLRRGVDLCKAGPGHKSNFSEEFVGRVIDWLRSLPPWGYAGDPAEFSKLSWR